MAVCAGLQIAVVSAGTVAGYMYSVGLVDFYVYIGQCKEVCVCRFR